ncbi:hypothetical protein EDD29_1157 [Actinocorallia herbida]|uniref:Cytidine deaminase n=1 Tax=Actinocorallia herbida TaxID=58109 RepID=A0A3N1CQS0_9ACTN|nr:cytidine deaminase [Actinocorallia herbida]ROO83650.1 hypothetical protein EDD29_1157 [Actinocorallia herbida]
MNPEDEKLIKLARATRARNGAEEGAAVRDETGRTYTASTVALPSLALTALQTAVAMAVASGAESLEAAVVVTPAGSPDIAAVRDLAQDAPVLVCALDGSVRETL